MQGESFKCTLHSTIIPIGAHAQTRYIYTVFVCVCVHVTVCMCVEYNGDYRDPNLQNLFILL